MPKRTRERQLAKQAARRQAERRARKRKRDMTLAIVAGVAAVVLLVVAASMLFGSQDTGDSAASVTPTVTPPSPCGSPKPPASASETKPQFKHPPPMTIDPQASYTATFHTTCGTFAAELLPHVAPEGVNNFVFLADEGIYDGLVFHRIVKDFVIQGGDPQGTGKGGPGYGFPIETSKVQTFDAAGILAYANSGPDTNGSQFFVTLKATPFLDPTPQGSYTIFGKVTKGMDVVQKIGSVPTVAGPNCPSGEICSPTEPVFIKTVTIDES